MNKAKKKKVSFILAIFIATAGLSASNIYAQDSKVMGTYENAYSHPSSVNLGNWNSKVENPAFVTGQFVSAVNRWLRKYDPSIEDQRENYVNMMVRYGGIQYIEFFLNPNDTYTIIVSSPAKVDKNSKEKVIHLGNGVIRELLNIRIRDAKISGRILP